MKYSIISLAFFLFSGLSSAQVEPTNIILMIGDGTGLSQITAGMYANDNKTNLESFEVIGLAKTHSSNALVTDSAASGTAMACGIKTMNGVIGIGVDNVHKESILKLSKKKNYATGLIATSSIVHATPASFYANVISRRQYEDIAFQMSVSDVDFFIGGGKKHFVRRKDGRNLLDEMNEWQFTSSLRIFDESTRARVGYFTNDDEPVRIVEGRKPTLKDGINSMFKKLTEKENPFFLMVEGSQIDWGGHANDLRYITTEFKDFDEAIGQAVAFVKENPNTLLIVTADHETGGLGISSGNIKNFKPKGGFVTGGHTASMVPVFAMGVGAETFGGIYENTAIFDKMLAVLSKN
ncbi:MAG: alkaline phosphatase [Flavobacteriaceae bacterium]